MMSSSQNMRRHQSIESATVAVESIPGAISSARAAQVKWADTPLAIRLKRVRVLRHLIAENGDRLARASASARRRPALESLTAEVLPLAGSCRFLERKACSILRTQQLGARALPLWLRGIHREIRRVPLGVVLIIGPGNYPLLLPGVQLIQALVAGNAVLLKPGEGGAGVACLLRQLVLEAGFDSQLVSLLPESADAARAAIEARPDKVLFTGSAETGEKILLQLAPHLVPATMELSGSDAVVIRADADLDLATRALAFGLTLNAGATCMAPKRVFVHRTVATELEGRLARAFPVEDSLRLAPGVSSRLRPMIEQALAAGSHVIADALHNDGAVLAPVVLGGAVPSHRLMHEDAFAPVMVLATVGDDDEAVAQANDCPFALGAAVFSRDESRARALAARLHTGVVTINDLIIPTADAHLPFGGRRRSGFGVTRGAEGLLELTVPKVVTVSRARHRPALEPPHPRDGAMFEAYLILAHSCAIRRRARALIELLKSLIRRSSNPRHTA